MFKALHKDTSVVGQHQAINREEFYSFYEVQGMRWKQVNKPFYCNDHYHLNIQRIKEKH